WQSRLPASSHAAFACVIEMCAWGTTFGCETAFTVTPTGDLYGDHAVVEPSAFTSTSEPSHLSTHEPFTYAISAGQCAPDFVDDESVTSLAEALAAIIVVAPATAAATKMPRSLPMTAGFVCSRDAEPRNHEKSASFGSRSRAQHDGSRQQTSGAVRTSAP